MRVYTYFKFAVITIHDCLSPIPLFPAERSVVIAEAVVEAKTHSLRREHARKAKLQEAGKSKFSSMHYKQVTKKARRQGEARELFENMVRKAERKLAEVQRNSHAQTQSAEEKAEELATELFHRPGSLLTNEEIAQLMEESGCKGRFEEEEPQCFTPTFQRFRKIDGTCNNLDRPFLGAHDTMIPRLIPAQYEDGISSLRGNIQARQGSILNTTAFRPPTPSARHVSQTVVKDIDADESLTHILMQWGQFTDHDLSLSPELEDGCPERAENCEFTEACQPIRVTDLDPAFGTETPNNGACIAFSRSIALCEDPDEPLVNRGIRPREQVNVLTSFIDGSMVYGADEEFALKLRAFQGGLLKEGESVGGRKPELPRILPEENIRSDGEAFVGCPPAAAGELGCFLAGEFRVNEQVVLTVMHTIWFREHNRIARELAVLNPSWDDERLYQETRRIVGAIIQKITYEDYLPLIFGPEVYEIVIGKFVEYDPRINPGVHNAFATAAYRYGHTLIRPFFDRLGSNYEPMAGGPLNLRDVFFNPAQFRMSYGTDPLLRGLVTQNSRRVDEFLSSVLTTDLFRTHLDLASLNIQRGRDHGLPPYLTWKRYCEEVFPELGPANFENTLTFVRFLELYGSLDTVDLWVGGLAEERLPGSLLGLTFACLFGITFGNVRDGDRFFYQRVGFFESEQLASIKEHTLSRVICDNSDGITEIQPDSFRRPAAGNARGPCSSLPAINLELWREDQCVFKISAAPRNFIVPLVVYHRLETAKIFNIDNVIIPINGQSDESICVNTVCPGAGENVVILIQPTSPALANLLKLQTNPLVPGNVDPLLKIFQGLWPNALYGESGTGIFRSMEDCEASNDIALTITLGGSSIQDTTTIEQINANKTTNPFNPNTFIQIPQEFLDLFFNFPPRGTPGTASEEGNTPEPENDGVSDAQLMSDLEEALKSLNL